MLNDDDLIPEYVYITGKLSNKKNNNPSIIYKLKTNRDKKYMKIDFVTNSRLFKWEVFADEKLANNITTVTKFINGRSIMTLQTPENLENNCLYLKIYNDDNIYIISKLSNYVFKYLNGDSEWDFNDFPHAKDVLNYNIGN